MFKVYCPERIEQAGLDFLLERGYEVITGASTAKEDLIREVAQADAAIVRFGATFDADVLEAGKRLQVVARHGVGYNNIDTRAAARLGIYVTNAKASNANAVAEHAVMLMLLLAKQVPRYHNTLTQGKWSDREQAKTEEIRGRTAGVVGYGANGSRFGQKAHGLGMRVICYDPYVDYTKLPDWTEGMSSLEEVLEQADVVSLHCPLDKDTYHCVAWEQLERMKPTAYLVNCARGGLVDEQALYRALVEGRIAGAALDVFETEPPDAELPLLKLNNFYGSLHQAGMSVAASDACALYAAQGVDDVLNGKKPKYPVNVPDETLFQKRRERK